jgi:hypothetical protein
MMTIEQAFADAGLTGLTKDASGDYHWGVWDIVILPGNPQGYYAVDTAGPIDTDSPWPLHSVQAFELDELVNEMIERGPDALAEREYTEMQARLDEQRFDMARESSAGHAAWLAEVKLRLEINRCPKRAHLRRKAARS